MTDDLAEFKTLYPNLSPDDLIVAKENLDRYLALAWEVWEERESAAPSDKPACVDKAD